MNFKTFTTTVLTFMLLIGLTGSISAQHNKTMKFKKGEVTIIHGLGAIVKNSDDKLLIEMVMPNDQRPKDYKGVDLKKGDLIMMCNGKKVKTAADLDAVIETVKAGDEISLGIKRDKKMLIVSFPKADQGQGGQMMVMTQEIDGGGDADVHTSMNFNGKEVEDVVLLEVGIVLQKIDNGFTVLAVMDRVAESIEGSLPKEGDLIVSLNGQMEDDVSAFHKMYGSIDNGEKIKLTFSRDGKELSCSFVKQAMSGGEMIIEED
jgi:PDZ domain-containing secreted protein